MSTDQPGMEAEQRPEPMALFKQTLENSTVEKSATQVQREELEWSQSLAKHSFELEDLSGEHAEKKFGRVLFDKLGDKFSKVRDSEAYGSLIRLGRAAEADGPRRREDDARHHPAHPG